MTRPSAGWELAIGAIVTKTEISKRYGGSIYGGIEPSQSTPNIMVFSDPSQGEQHGYQFDGWVAGEPGVFLYTGEGQYGDQKLTHGNKAIADHVASGRTLRLFLTLPNSQGPGGKKQRYAGAFAVDSAEPYTYERAPDNEGELRKVIVFRLLATEVEGYPESPIAQPEVTVGVKKQLQPEKPLKLCPKCQMELLPSGECPMDCD